MIEILTWVFSMVPGLAVIIFAMLIIVGFFSGFICYRIARRVNYKQWPADAQEEKHRSDARIKELEDDLRTVTVAYNERYAVDREIKRLLNAIDNRILKRRKP